MSSGSQTKAKAPPLPITSFAPVRTGLLQQRSLLDGTPGLLDEFTDFPGKPLLSQPPLIQAKLTIGQPNDRYEQEADRMADLVMRMPEPRIQRQVEPEEEEEEILQAKPLFSQIAPLIQRQVEPEEEEEEELTLQTKLLPGQNVSLIQRQVEPENEEEEEEPIQAKQVPGRSPKVTPELAARIQSLRGGGQPLAEPTRAFFEPRFGHDFNKVRIHTDAQAAEATQAVNARAFTAERDVIFGAGQYALGTSEGRLLLAHELAHVMQQTTGSAIDRMQAGYLSINALSDVFEQAADQTPDSVPRDLRNASQSIQVSLPTIQRKPGSSKGGPYHPPIGIKTRCTEFDDCSTLSLKINYLKHIIKSHVQWDIDNPRSMYPGGRHAAEEIPNFRRALKRCIGLYSTKCTNQPVFIEQEQEQEQEAPESSKWLLPVATGLLLFALLRKAKQLSPYYRCACTLSALWLLASGCAEAKIGLEGDDPVEELFKSLEESGTPAPPELRQFIENNPDIKEALKTGDLSEVQAELNRQLTQLIEENFDQFTPEELEQLLTATVSAQDALPDGDLTVDRLRQALAQARVRGTGTGRPETKEGAKPGKEAKKIEQTTAQGKGGRGTAASPTEEAKEIEKVISTGEPPQRELFSFIKDKTGQLGIKCDARFAEDYLRLTKQLGLKESDVEDLERLGILTKPKSPDDILEGIKKGLKRIREIREEKVRDIKEETLKKIQELEPYYAILGPGQTAVPEPYKWKPEIFIIGKTEGKGAESHKYGGFLEVKVLPQEEKGKTWVEVLKKPIIYLETGEPAYIEIERGWRLRFPD